jgi:hypothetical protein
MESSRLFLRRRRIQVHSARATISLPDVMAVAIACQAITALKACKAAKRGLVADRHPLSGIAILRGIYTKIRNF